MSINGVRDDSNNVDDVVARGQLITSSGELFCNNNVCETVLYFCLDRLMISHCKKIVLFGC